MSKKGIYKRRFLWYIICENNEIGDADMEEKVKFEDVRLFTEDMLKSNTEKSLHDTRLNNTAALSYLKILFLDMPKATTEEAKERLSKKLTLLSDEIINVNNPSEKDEYLKALKFFTKNKDAFSKSQLGLAQGLSLLYQHNSVNSNTGKNPLAEYHKTETYEARLNAKDIDVRKIAALFAQDGNYQSEHAKIIEGKKFDAVSEGVYKNLINLRDAVVEYYTNNIAKQQKDMQ